MDDQLGLDRAGDVAVQVVAGVDEQLGDQRLVALGADDQVDVRRAPRAPVGGGGHLAGRPVERDRVRPRDHRDELVAAIGAGPDLAAQVALRRTRHEARVAALGVRLPDVEVGVGQRLAVGVGHDARDDRAVAGLVGAVGELERRVEQRRVGQVERAEDRALGAVAVAEHLLLDDVLDVDVAEQRPLAGLADVDEPLLGGLVLLVGDVVLDDRLVDSAQDVADQQVGTVRHGVLLLGRWRWDGAPAA